MMVHGPPAVSTPTSSHAQKLKSQPPSTADGDQPPEEQAAEQKQPRGFGVAAQKAVDSIRHAPHVALQAALAASTATGLAWEHPGRSKDLVVMLLQAAKEGTLITLRQRGTLGSAVQHGQEGAHHAGEVQRKAPDSTKNFMEKGASAVRDAVHGAVRPSAQSLGIGGVEGGESGGSAAGAASQAPDNAAGAAVQSSEAGATGASIPFREPLLTIKAAWHGNSAAGGAAALTASAPQHVKDTASTANAAAQEVGAAVGSVLDAAAMAPGGNLTSIPIILLLTPWVLVAAMGGAAFGVFRELTSRVITGTLSFVASCISSAALVVAWRAAYAFQPEEAYDAKGDKPPVLASSLQPTGIVLPSARAALESARVRYTDAERRATAPLTVAGEALAAAGRTTRHNLAKLAFWRRDERTVVGGAVAAVTSETPRSVFEHDAINTPAGPLLPFLAWGLPNTRYAVHPQHKGRVGLLRTPRYLLTWFLHAQLASWMAAADTLLALWHTLWSRQPVSEKLHSLVSMLLQPTLLLVGAGMALLDTAVWWVRKASTRPLTA